MVGLFSHKELFKGIREEPLGKIIRTLLIKIIRMTLNNSPTEKEMHQSP